MKLPELTFEFLREQIVGIDSTLDTPYGKRLMVYCDYTASGRCLLFVERYLQKRGHRVRVAANGRLGVDAHAAGAYDLILMDVQMPEMDGLEATREIRRREAEDHVPIIGLTAHASNEDRDRCLAAGMDGYLTKPVNLEALDGIVEDVRDRALQPA